MAERTTDKTARKENDDSVIEKAARTVGELVESGATAMGRGLAAGAEGMANLTERAAEMTGITSPSAAGKTAESAARTTMTATPCWPGSGVTLIVRAASLPPSTMVLTRLGVSDAAETVRLFAAVSASEMVKSKAAVLSFVSTSWSAMGETTGHWLNGSMLSPVTVTISSHKVPPRP